MFISYSQNKVAWERPIISPKKKTVKVNRGISGAGRTSHKSHEYDALSSAASNPRSSKPVSARDTSDGQVRSKLQLLKKRKPNRVRCSRCQDLSLKLANILCLL